MKTIDALAAVFGGVLLINVVLSAVLWARQRTVFHRALFFLWSASMVGLVLQGALSKGHLLITLGFSSTFLVNVALAHLLSILVGVPIPTRRFIAGFLVAIAASVVAAKASAAFWLVSLPVALAVALPLAHTAFRAARALKGTQGTTSRALIVTCFVFAAHNIDFSFLRDKEQLAPVGLTLALLVVFALSITANAVVLERSAMDRARVEELNRIQRSFFANITHELRTPLTMILAPLESMLAGDLGPLPAPQRAYLEANWRNGLRLLKLINDLLDLAKLDEGFVRLRLDKTELAPLLTEVVEYTRPLAARKRLSLDLEIRRTPTNLFVDLEKIDRVVNNLLANALKFTETGGVRITLDVVEGEAQIVVEDTGIGVPADRLEAIFERFSQADASVTRRFGGTGIGLAYAREIVQLHGGRITVTSTPGVGSRFVVHLREGEGHVPEAMKDRRLGAAGPGDLKRTEDVEPKEWALRLQGQEAYRFSEIGDATERRIVPGAARTAKSTRVLVVEDHAEILELIHLQLQQEHAVYVAQNGRQGLELAQRERPDVIVTDFMMPEMDGLSLLRALRADPATVDIPVVMLTAKNQLADRLDARQAGADVYLAKPFSPRELAVAVRQLLEKRGRQVGRLIQAHVEGLETVSAGIAHEINNPLGALKSAHALVVENVAKIREAMAAQPSGNGEQTAAVIRKADEKISRVVATSTRSIRRIEDVVALVRRYAREGYPDQPTDLDLDAAVRDVATLVSPPGDEECAVSLDLAGGGARVRCIPEEMSQVIRNLVQNAVDAAGAGGRVDVRTRKENEIIVLEVTDNGPGIPPENLTKIFSPFFTTKPGTGMGLGLAIVHQVVSRTNGSVEVSSVPHQDTTFRVRLPAVAPS